MIRTIFRVFSWVTLTFALPAWLFIFGMNIFLSGAGINFHIDHNSLTYLGLFIARLALPVTPPAEPTLNMLPLRRIEKDDPLMQEIEKAIQKQQEEDKKDDDSSGPSSSGN